MSSLIALYLADLAHNRSPACRHVQAAVGRSVGEEGAGPGGSIELLERGSDELGSLLVKATLEVWQAYRASAAGRGPLVLEIDAARAGYHMRRCSAGVLNFKSVALDTVQTKANHRISLTT